LIVDERLYLGSKRAQLEYTLDGEHGREDQVQVTENVHELQRSSLELEKQKFIRHVHIFDALTYFIPGF
jgi:hypothetical protein